MKRNVLKFNADLEIAFIHDGKENVAEVLKKHLEEEFGTDDKEILNALLKHYIMKELLDSVDEVVFDVKSNIDWEIK